MVGSLELQARYTLPLPATKDRAYLDNLDLKFNDLDAQMCWDCWPNDDTPFEEVETGDST